jgi:hypothetical protein
MRAPRPAPTTRSAGRERCDWALAQLERLLPKAEPSSQLASGCDLMPGCEPEGRDFLMLPKVPGGRSNVASAIASDCQATDERPTNREECLK